MCSAWLVAQLSFKDKINIFWLLFYHSWGAFGAAPIEKIKKIKKTASLNCTFF